jgi:DnaJ-class molecular chaperone
MQKAYGYLTNPTTRIIYDRFGVQGIKVYEMFADEFREVSEELRTQDLDEAKKKELENVRLRLYNLRCRKY